MSLADPYRACSTSRRSKDDIDDIKGAIVDVLRADYPMTVRQVFYQLVARSVIEKTEAEYQGTVIRLLTNMRLEGEIPFHWIVDESRRTMQVVTFDNLAEAVNDTARYYRRSALRECPDYIEIWSEKQALAGIIWEVASEYGVPVVVSKGMPSLTQVHQTALAVYNAGQAGKDSYIYQFGDHDPTGALIPRSLDKTLSELCCRLDCGRPSVIRMALTEPQIEQYRLPTRPTKREGNRHAKNFEGDSVELDALPSRTLRMLVESCIACHILPEQLEALRVTDESERQILKAWAAQVTEGDLSN